MATSSMLMIVPKRVIQRLKAKEFSQFSVASRCSTPSRSRRRSKLSADDRAGIRTHAGFHERNGRRHSLRFLDSQDHREVREPLADQRPASSRTRQGEIRAGIFATQVLQPRLDLRHHAVVGRRGSGIAGQKVRALRADGSGERILQLIDAVLARRGFLRRSPASCRRACPSPVTKNNAARKLMMRNGGTARYQRPKPSKASLKKVTRFILSTMVFTVQAARISCNARAKQLRMIARAASAGDREKLSM